MVESTAADNVQKSGILRAASAAATLALGAAKVNESRSEFIRSARARGGSKVCAWIYLSRSPAPPFETYAGLRNFSHGIMLIPPLGSSAR